MMTNYLFLILFTIMAYGIVRYFAYLTKDRENHEDGGLLSSLFFGRLLFFLGLPILGIFIYDIFQIHFAADQGSGLIGLVIMLGSVLVLIIGEVIYKKGQKGSSHR
ncbi:small-conductance mechanosensitive channel [Streptococcus rupicaprae]|uniref:Small-conductance mechanosensitive channel n=1 Tax=Streptococcus rupicaprae TaxID=759619 RepID=A0ABV2FGZ8_9STRE